MDIEELIGTIEDEIIILEDSYVEIAEIFMVVETSTGLRDECLISSKKIMEQISQLETMSENLKKILQKR